MGRKKRGCIVKKSNAIIRGHWEITNIWEPRLVALLASKIHVDDEDFKVYNLRLSEILGSHYSGKDMQLLEECVKKAMKHVIVVDLNPTDRAYYNIFSKCVFRSEKRVLELQFHPDLKSEYLGLKEMFTQYSLEEFMSLSSVYSQRMYEILKSWDERVDATMPVEVLYDMLNVPASYRNDFAQFRRRVLEFTHEEILKKTKLWYEWESIKSGRSGKVVAVRFVFDWKKAQGMGKNLERDPLSMHKKVQRDSNACFERIVLKGKKCSPKAKSARCKFCLERGRMFAQSIAQQGKLFDESANSPSTA